MQIHDNDRRIEKKNQINEQIFNQFSYQKFRISIKECFRPQ